jgi:hypothetical protein
LSFFYPKDPVSRQYKQGYSLKQNLPLLTVKILYGKERGLEKEKYFLFFYMYFFFTAKSTSRDVSWYQIYSMTR